VRINHINWFVPSYVIIGYEYTYSEDDTSDYLLTDHSIELITLTFPTNIQLSSDIEEIIDVEFCVVTDFSGQNEQVAVPVLTPPEIAQRYSSYFIPSWYFIYLLLLLL
jgi:hypothetical protein